MKKPYIIAMIVLGIVIFLILLNELTILALLNNPINKLVAGEPRKTCNQDSDCKKIFFTECNGCGCTPIAVNKGWNTYCPIKSAQFLCDCRILNRTVVKCINNQCTLIPDQSEQQ